MKKNPVEEHLRKLDKQRPHRVNIDKILENWKQTSCLACFRRLKNKDSTQLLVKPFYCDSDKCKI